MAHFDSEIKSESLFAAYFLFLFLHTIMLYIHTYVHTFYCYFGRQIKIPKLNDFNEIKFRWTYFYFRRQHNELKAAHSQRQLCMRVYMCAAMNVFSEWKATAVVRF